MPKSILLEQMEELSFFKDMTVEERSMLCDTEGAVVTYKENEPVLRQGDIDTAFFIVLDGQLSVSRNKPPEVFLASLVPGSLFGEVTMRGDRPRTSSVIADFDVTVLKVDQALLDKIEPRISSKIKDQIIRLLARRLDEMNNKLVSFIR
jgi:CRP-like cAMP-binding protein